MIFELDGATHGTDAEIAADAARTEFLFKMGFRVCRARNSEIYENLNGILVTLLGFVETNPARGAPEPVAAPHPNPLPVANGNRERE